jgi:ribosomal protein S6
MGDIISLNKMAQETKEKSLSEQEELKLMGLKEVNKIIKDSQTAGFLFFSFDQEGNTELTAAGQLDPPVCCMALDRVKYQIMMDIGGE